MMLIITILMSLAMLASCSALVEPMMSPDTIPRRVAMARLAFRRGIYEWEGDFDKEAVGQCWFFGNFVPSYVDTMAPYTCYLFRDHICGKSVEAPINGVDYIQVLGRPPQEGRPGSKATDLQGQIYYSVSCDGPRE